MNRIALLLRRTCLFGILATLVALPSVSPSSAQEKTAITSGSLRVNVVDEQNQPLAKAKLLASVWTQEKDFKATQNYTCDAEGICEIKLPRTAYIVRIWAAKAGYAGMFVNMQGDAKKDEFVVPSEFTFRLPMGTMIGGVLEDDEGQPIAGAKIDPSYQVDRSLQGDRSLQVHEGGYAAVPAFFDDEAITDAQGRWKIDTVYPGEAIAVRIAPSHPDFIQEEYDGELAREQNVSMKALRDQTAVIRMQRGVTVTGKVTDPAGKPVAGAVVIWGDRPYWQTGSQELRTGADGTYQFPALAPGSTRLTVVAEGWMPASRKIEITRGMQPADFALKAGKKLRIRFVDPSGTPIPGVGISIDKWRGAEALYTHKHPNVIDTKIPRKADDNGVYEWTWAPDDAVMFTFGKQGFAVTEASIVANDAEHVQTINHILRFAGSVRDAATGRAIDGFLAIPVIYFRPDFPYLDRSHAVRQKGGELSIELERTDIEHGLQIEAAGYRAYRTPGRVKSGDRNPGLKVELEPVAPYAGRVLDAQGQPVKAARVYVATEFQHLDLTNLANRDGQSSSNYEVTTDERGAFEIVPPIEKYAVVAIADAGYAEVERAAGDRPGDIRLQPWASLKGRLVQNGQPVKNCQVLLVPIRLQNGDQPRINEHFYAMSGSDGSFAFEKVPPIPCVVRGFLHFSEESPLTSSQSLPLLPLPGQSLEISLGRASSNEGGVEVTGTLAAENQPKDFDYHFALNYLVARRPGIEPPAAIAAKGFDWRKGWSEAWDNSLEGRAYLNTLHHWFVKPAPHGRISISGVAPGDYDFVVNLYGTTEGCLVHPLASRVLRVNVPSGKSKLDLGNISIPSMALPQVGQPAPAFEFATLDGKSNSLAALRGQYVLLDFWATWCAPCVAKLNEVERLRKQFTGREELTVIGVNLDGDQERAREFLKSRSLPWQHALLGDWSATDVPQRFAIASIPSYVLIGPDGNIAALESSLEAIEKRLAVGREIRE